MTEPYLFEKAIGQQMGDLCRLAMGDAKVTQTGEIVTLENMLGRGTMGVSVEVPYTSGGVQSVNVERCGKNLYNIASQLRIAANNADLINFPDRYSDGILTFGALVGIAAGAPIPLMCKPNTTYSVYFKLIRGSGISGNNFVRAYQAYNKTTQLGIIAQSGGYLTTPTIPANHADTISYSFTTRADNKWLGINAGASTSRAFSTNEMQVELGSTATDYEPYNGDTYTITLPTTIYGGTVNLEAGTVTSRYAADGTELAEPVVTEIDPISIPILAGVNNVWADVGTVTVSYYAADAETFRPALWYPTIYRGLTSARYLIKRASGAIASFSYAVAAPLVGLRVALPYDAEGYQSVSVTVNSDTYTIHLPTTIYGGYLDVVTGQLVATHDENGNLLTNQKLYFLPPTNINALAGVNNVWSDAGDVAVSYRIDNG